MRLGFYYVMTVPYAAGLACFGGPFVGGFRITGWIFAVMLAVAPLVFVLDRRPSRFPIWMWMPWVCTVFLSLLWADQLSLPAFQNVCQLVTPFVIAPVAAKSIKTQSDMSTLVRSYLHCLLILLAGLALNVVAGVGILARPMAMTAAMVGCVLVAQVREHPLVAVLGWSGCLLIAAVTGGRMATFAVLLEWLVFPRYRRQITRVFLALAIAAVAVGLFYTSLFQERFFLEGRGTLGDVSRGQFFSSGRFEAWPELWKEVARRPLLGAGAHASARIVGQVWDGMAHPHNDYLRILLDQGFVGLAFFLVGVLSQLASLWHHLRRITGKAAVIRSSACMGIVIFLLIAATDNPIAYGVWFMHPLFVLIGASYARVEGVQNRQQIPGSATGTGRTWNKDTPVITI